ncbi:MAG: AAA family ATPase, partial [Candidatus Ratteibacteria bacterium]|nr:AAA family ATPase [Candidatus Ratteibacteria bacterium]
MKRKKGRSNYSLLRYSLLKKATAIVTIAVFLFNSVFIDLVWAYSARADSFLRAIPAEKAWVSKAIGKRLGKEPDEGNIASGNWTEEYHNELNAQIRKLIGKKGTDVTRQYPVEKQKKELNVLLKDFFVSISEEEKAKWNNIISDANLAVGDVEELFKKLAGLLDSKKTGFFYLKPPKGIFYLKRQGLPPLIAEEHFGYNRKSKTDKKEINNVYIAEPSVKLKTYEEQQGIILHGLVHLLIGAGEAEHNFALKVQMRFVRYLLEKEIPADFLKKYSRYYELKSEILEAEKANDNSLYQKKRAELIKTVDDLRELTETIPDEQFKRAFELLKLNQIENQEDVNLMLGSFDEFYHLSTPEYNNEEKAALGEIAREMAQGLKKWYNPDEVYQEAMSAMKPFHIKNLLPERIDEKNELKRRFLSRQIKEGIQVFSRANYIGACFTRGLEAVSVLAKGLGNRDSSIPFLKATVKHELIHYFSFKGIIPIRYEREDISTAITVIEFLEQEGMGIFNKYQDFFTSVGAELYRAGAELQKEGKVFLDEDYLLKRAFEIFEADERLSDKAIMLVRDPAGKNAEETAFLTAQVNDMRQRVIGVIMAGALIQHSKESGEPLLETLIEFFKVLAEKAPIPRVAEIEEAIKQAKEQDIPEKNMQKLNQLLKQAQKQRAEVEKAKMNVVSWAKRATGIPTLSYVEAGGEIPQWVFLPQPHEKIVGVEDDLYRLSSRNAYYGLVVPPVFEAKYGAKVREKIMQDEFKDEPYFDLLWRIMDTPRIMAFGWHNYPGTIDWVKAVYEERFKEDNLLIAQTLLSAWARPLQYLDSFIYRWFKGIDEDRRLKNEDVRQAIENTRDAYGRVMETIAPEELYHLVKDEIWPEFKKLIDSEIAEQKEMELFKQEHQGVSPNQIQQMWDGMSDAERQAAQKEMERQWQGMSEEERQRVIDEVERQIQEAIEEYLAQSSRAQQGGGKSSQSPAMPDQAGSLKTSGFSQKPSEGKSKDMNRLAGQLQRMAERLKEKAENLSRQSNQAGKGTKGLSKEAEDVEGNAGAADLSKEVEELAKTAQETAEGFSSLKKQTKQFKNRADSLNETAKQSADLESADKMKQSSEKLNKTAEEMDKTAGKGKEVSQEAVEDAKQIKDIISKSGRREVNAIRQKAENISQKADELAEYAQDLAQQAGKAESQAGEVGQSASEMGMETAQKVKDKGKRIKDERAKDKAKTSPAKAELPTQQAGESSWEMEDQKDRGQKTESEALKGMDSLAQQAREKNKAEAGEFDLSKYLEEEKSPASRPKEEISKRTKEQIREHERQMKEMREENFLKKEGITVKQYQSYQRAKADVQTQIANIERELKSILVPGGGSDFLRERSYGEINDDSLAEIPAGKTKIFKQQQIPKKKKAIISLLVDISGSMEGEKLENAVLTALAFQEALKKFEFSSQVDLQFEVAGYSGSPYFYFKDYKDKLTIKRAFGVVNGLMSEAGGGTSDYQALNLAIQRLRQTKLGNDPEAKKIIFNITDGNAGRNAESIQELYARNPDIRVISFGIDKNEETARAIAFSYGPRYGVAVSDISTVPKAVMRRLKLELKRPAPSDVTRTIINNTLIFGFSALSGAILMGTNGLIQFMKDVDFKKLPKEEPVYEGSKFLIVRENRKEFLVYHDPETEEEKIRIERGARNNKRVPKIEWNPAFETEQNIEFLLKMFQRLEPREEDNLMRNLLLSGEAGTGKNVLIEYAAKLANKNLRLMSIHKRTDKNQLIKRRTFGEEKGPDGKYLRKTGWANSELVEAAINGDWIVLDEINKAEADNLGVLNDMLAMGRFIDKAGKTRKVDRDFRVIAAANPPDGIYAVKALSWEFSERMSRLELDYQKEENEIKLLQSWVTNVPKERIELLVQAAWNLRARYFGWTSRANMLAEDEVPAEKGTYMKRPISTAELRKIVEHFDKYPFDLENRPWSVINRHFSLANEDPAEVETMKEEIRSEFEGLGFQDKISVDDIIIQKENNQIEVKEDKATGVKTRFWKIKPDKGGDELNLKLIDEGPADKNEEPEKVIDEVQRNLVRFYDIAKDISLGSHLLFTGHAGTGKNVIADFVSYMLAGGAYTYLISMNKLIEPGDLTAWRGFAELSKEEKTEWIESFVVKAMREGKPVIIDEVNKADPGVVAILNSLLQTNTLTLPSGEVVEAKPGFCLIATMNPPISGLYEGVEPLSGEFIRRFSIHEFDYLPFEQELEILKKTGKYKVNEKYIERLLMAAAKLREKYIQEGAIAGPPSMRSLKRTVAYIRDHGDRLPGGKKKRKDEQIFEIFKEDFPLDDRTQKEVVKGIFQEADIGLLPAGRVDENTPDAIDELLDGQPLVLRGEIKIEPDTGDKATDNILKVLQLNYDAVGAGKKIEALAKLIEERISEWNETDFRRHIESALYFGEIMKVTLVIRGMAHSKDNLRALEELEKRMEKHLLAYHWPATFFVEAPEIDTALLKLLPKTQSPEINEIFGLLQIFFGDENYRKDLLKILRNEYIESKFRDIVQGRLDESTPLEKDSDEIAHRDRKSSLTGSIDEANLLSRMKKILDKIAKDVKTQDAKALKELSSFITKKLKESGWPTYAKASAGRPASSRKFEDENILWQRYLGVLQQSAGLKDKEEIEAARKEAEETFEKAKDLEEARVDALYSSDVFWERIFELLWGVQTARAPNAIKHRLEQFDKEFINDFMKVWENKVYDNVIILQFLWMKDYLSEILTSLDKDNAYRPKECAKIIKDYINKIDEQFKAYHWPEYQRLRGPWGFYEGFPIIGGPVKIDLTQEPIAFQPVVGQVSGGEEMLRVMGRLEDKKDKGKRIKEKVQKGEIDLEKTERYKEIKEYIEKILKGIGRDLAFEKSFIEELNQLKSRGKEMGEPDAYVKVRKEVKEGDIFFLKWPEHAVPNAQLKIPLIITEKLSNDLTYVVVGKRKEDVLSTTASFNYIAENYIHLPKKILDELAEGEEQKMGDGRWEKGDERRETKDEGGKLDLENLLEEWLGEEGVGDRKLKKRV